MADPSQAAAAAAQAANPARQFATFTGLPPAPGDDTDVLGGCVPAAGANKLYLVCFTGYFYPVPSAAKTDAAAALLRRRHQSYYRYRLDLLIDAESARNTVNLDPGSPSQPALSQRVDLIEGWCQDLALALEQYGVRYHGRVTAAAMQSLLNSLTATFWAGQ